MLRLRKMTKGQSMVELALVLPTLALLLVVVADFARVFYLSIAVANAARAGVAYGSQSLLKAIQFDSIQQAALNDGQNIAGLTATASDVCMCNGAVVACSPAACAQPQTYVQVTTRTTFHTLLNYPGVPSTIPISYTAMMEVRP
ncbi:MAG TPA: TadE/TadG family type IV pilus assembly protein [Candidatus Binataceae bacterium]|jgi:Flp pilus assembly protein TadG|nr:TadE/TadG family type IV pilus assembly protein [Candidatus Binataceae bacterium]